MIPEPVWFEAGFKRVFINISMPVCLGVSSGWRSPVEAAVPNNRDQGDADILFLRVSYHLYHHTQLNPLNFKEVNRIFFPEG